MKRMQGALAAAVLVLGFGGAAVAPASAATGSPAAAEPAVVSCSFGELYDDEGLTDFNRYVARNTQLSVSGRSNTAWRVTIHTSGNPVGWMSGECVRFLA